MIENPEQLCDFYFELSNEDRLRILNLLTKKPMKLTNLAKSLDISNQECSRHLQRLTEADIIDKNTEGNYELTNYGSISLILQENQRFITEYREYFNEHSVLGLPREYLSRIGELNGGNLNKDPIIAVHDIEELVEQAEEYIYSVIDQYPANIYQLIESAWKRGVKMRTIECKDWRPPPQFIDERDEAKESFETARKKGLLEERCMEKIPVILFGSEKVANIYFPDNEGDFDYQGFMLKDSMAMKWCEDLFKYHWEHAKQKLYSYPYGDSENQKN
jgi:predicted transcriptional regulator